MTGPITLPRPHPTPAATPDAARPSTSAQAHLPAGSRRSSPAPDTPLHHLAAPTEPGAFDLPGDGDDAVAIGRHRLSGRPKPLDDFSGRTLLSRLQRLAARLKNVDGPDDLSGALQLALPAAGQPYASIGLLGALFPLVAAAAAGAVKAAAHSYRVAYPDTVQAVLAQQQRLVDELREDGASAVDLEPLQRLLEAGRERHERRQAARQQGLRHLVAHNLRTHHQPGNSRQARAFVEAASALVAARLQGHELTAGQAYELQRTATAARESRAAKKTRKADLLSGAGVSAMAAGMATSAGTSGATAAANAAEAAGDAARAAAAATADTVLGNVTGGVLLPAQLAQAAAGGLNARHALQGRRHLQADRAAVHRLGDAIGPGVQAQHAQASQFLLARNRAEAGWNGVLAVSQAGMAGMTTASLAGAPAFVTAPLALLFAGGTIASAIGRGRAEDKLRAFTGAGTPAALQSQLATGDLAGRLRQAGLDGVLADVAAAFAGRQHDVSEVGVWMALLHAIEKEDVLAASAPAESRRRKAFTDPQARRHAPPWMLPENRREAEEIRRTRYGAGFMQQPAVDIHKALYLDIARHPVAQKLAQAAGFRQQLLYRVTSRLAKLDDPAVQALFRDGEGRRVGSIAWAPFMDFMAHCLPAQKVYVEESNKLFVEQLGQALNYARYDKQRALEDLARTAQVFADAGEEPVVILRL